MEARSARSAWVNARSNRSRRTFAATRTRVPCSRSLSTHEPYRPRWIQKTVEQPSSVDRRLAVGIAFAVASRLMPLSQVTGGDGSRRGWVKMETNNSETGGQELVRGDGSDDSEFTPRRRTTAFRTPLSGAAHRAICRRETAAASAAERGSLRFDGYQQLDMNTAMAGSRRAEGHTRAATAAKEHATALLAGVPDPGNTLRDQINGCDENPD
jgi:hypothetical protein